MISQKEFQQWWGSLTPEQQVAAAYSFLQARKKDPALAQPVADVPAWANVSPAGLAKAQKEVGEEWVEILGIGKLKGETFDQLREALFKHVTTPAGESVPSPQDVGKAGYGLLIVAMIVAFVLFAKEKK